MAARLTVATCVLFCILPIIRRRRKGLQPACENAQVQAPNHVQAVTARRSPASNDRAASALGLASSTVSKSDGFRESQIPEAAKASKVRARRDCECAASA